MRAFLKACHFNLKGCSTHSVRIEILFIFFLLLLFSSFFLLSFPWSAAKPSSIISATPTMLIWERSLSSLWTVLVEPRIYSSAFQSETNSISSLTSSDVLQNVSPGETLQCRNITLPPGVTITVGVLLTSSVCGGLLPIRTCQYFTHCVLAVCFHCVNGLNKDNPGGRPQISSSSVPL